MMTTTRAKPAAVRFLPTKIAVVGGTVAGFLGLWAGIAASAGTASIESPVDETAVAELTEPEEFAGQVVVVERQVIYVMAGAQPANSAAPPAAVPAAPAPQAQVSAPAPPRQPASAPRPTAKTSRGS